MHKISAFTENEIPLVAECAELIKANGADIYSTYILQNKDLEIFAGIVSRTPSLRNNERYGFSKRDIGTMAAAISTFGTANQLLIPSRARLGREFIISKINFYYFTLKILSNFETDPKLTDEIKRYCEKLVFSLMAEEAYEAIIESPLTDKQITRIAADELSYLWEYRMDRNLNVFSPPLIALWKERCNVIPILGTLAGTIEVIRLSTNLPDIWVDFLANSGKHASTAMALEEFVFGISYEDLKRLREIMKASHISAVNRSTAVEILKKENSSFDEKQEMFTAGDAKEIYAFFHKRLEATWKRKLLSEQGPVQTIEELFLIYILEKKSDNIGQKVKDSISNFIKQVKSE